jgi:predicted DNA-binding protein with PD1-like motif
MANKQQVKDMADRLISTLDSLMPSERADAIVRDVAEELYREVLGIPGSIVVDRNQPSGHMHIGGARGVKKQILPLAKYKFEAKQ